MNNDVDRGRRDELLTKGYTLFENVLPVDFLNELRQVTDAILEAQTAEQQARYRSQGSMFPTTVNPVFARLIALPEALQCLHALGYPHPTFSDGYIISKPGYRPDNQEGIPPPARLFWHYDWFAWEDGRSYEAEPSQLFLMYYLTDTRRENGCLRVIPGSHIHHNPLHDLLDEPHSAALGTAQNVDDRPEFSDRPDEVDVLVNAGDLVVGDARLLHAAHANLTSERRTLLTLWYQPDLAALPERMQAQMAAKVQPIPTDWPADAQETVVPLLTTYRGEATPYPRSLYRKRSS